MLDWPELAAMLEAATGADGRLDGAVAAGFGVSPADYTASVDHCRDLVASVLPGWALHVGFGASGIFPYALLSNGDRRHMADAGTVPLAILRAAAAVLAEGAAHARSSPGIPRVTDGA